MRIDIHCHVIGNGKDISKVNEDVYLNADDNQIFFTRILANLLDEELIRMEADLNNDGIISTSEYFETFPPGCLIHGTDFPIPIDSWPHLPLVTHDITPEEYLGICKTKNFLDRDVRIKRAHGFSDSILGNAEKVLRLPGRL